MKTLKCTFVLICCFCYSVSYAQWHVGVNTGVSINNVSVSGLPAFVPDTKSLTGYSFGVQAEYDINNQVSVLSGLNYAQRGFSLQETMDINILGINLPIGAKAETRLNFIELPLLGKMNFGNENLRAYVLAGPMVSYTTTGQLKTKASLLFDINVSTTDINLGADIYNRTNLSGVVGGGIEIPNESGKFFADLRYNHSFTNMLNDPAIDIKIKTNGISLGIGYALSF